MSIDADLHQLATGKNFGALSTLAADGQPRTHIMWVDADDDHVIFNTEIDRAKFKDVERDPRVTVTVINAENPYQYVEARGRVVETITGPEARSHIDACSQKYTGKDYNPDAIKTERVICKVAVDKVHKNNF